MLGLPDSDAFAKPHSGRVGVDELVEEEIVWHGVDEQRRLFGVELTVRQACYRVARVGEHFASFVKLQREYVELKCRYRARRVANPDVSTHRVEAHGLNATVYFLYAVLVGDYSCREVVHLYKAFRVARLLIRTTACLNIRL